VGFDGALSDVQPRAGYQQPIDQTSVGAARSPRAARLGRPAGQPADQLLGPFGGVADLEAAELVPAWSARTPRGAPTPSRSCNMPPPGASDMSVKGLCPGRH
jgi:hypothetical protein